MPEQLTFPGKGVSEKRENFDSLPGVKTELETIVREPSKPTGIMNGKEAEGFAYLAQSLVAKSVIASLWKVSDAGTPELMIRFYKLRTENPNISKGEAFRQAQFSLLNIETGKAKTSDSRRSEIVNLSGKKTELPLYEKIGKPPFAHPHYWSSFILIGNWR